MLVTVADIFRGDGCEALALGLLVGWVRWSWIVLVPRPILRSVMVIVKGLCVHVRRKSMCMERMSGWFCADRVVVKCFVAANWRMAASMPPWTPVLISASAGLVVVGYDHILGPTDQSG